MLMHETKYQQYSFFVLDLGVFKLFTTLNSSNWLRVHSVPDSISMVHQSLLNVCDPLVGVTVGSFSKDCILREEGSWNQVTNHYQLALVSVWYPICYPLRILLLRSYLVCRIWIFATSRREQGMTGTEEGGKKIVIKRKLFSKNRTFPGLPILGIPMSSLSRMLFPEIAEMLTPMHPLRSGNAFLWGLRYYDTRYYCTVGSGNLMNFLPQVVSVHSFKNFKML